MQTSTRQQRREFSVWLRTGRRPGRGDSYERKFNPWHDPRDGRFTFAGNGRYFGPGDAGPANSQDRGTPRVVYVDDLTRPPIRSIEQADAWRADELAKHGHEPGYREAIEARYQRYKDSFVHRPDAQPNPSASQNTPSSKQEEFHGGGGSNGGGGVTGSWEDSPSPQVQRALESDPRSGPSPTSEGSVPGSGQGAEPSLPQPASEHWSSVSRNGYLYEIDAQNRTRRISGDLALNPNQGRSQAVQRAAGGSDRRASDHGGHYIARRFNGPTEAFNHFAQDANFNRGGYRRLEEEWARAKQSGKDVRVKIVPIYEGASQRPSALNVWFWIDGKPDSQKFPNEPKGTKNAKR